MNEERPEAEMQPDQPEASPVDVPSPPEVDEELIGTLQEGERDARSDRDDLLIAEE